MKKRLTSTTKALLAALLLLTGNYLHAQVTVGDGTAPQDFSVLELSTENLKGGLRLPHLSTQERNDLVLTPNFQAQKATMAKGLVIYNTDTDCMESWNGTKWISLCECATILSLSSDGQLGQYDLIPDTFATVGPVVPTLSEGAGTISYQWYSNTSNSYKGATPISGATGDSYTFTVGRGVKYYYCIVRNSSCGSSVITSELYSVGNCGANTTSNTTSNTWLRFMCHNLGADRSLDPFSYVEGYASGSGGTLGWLYQWGRPTDGHQLRNSATTTILATDNTASTPAGIQDKFILAPDSPYNWRNESITNLWGDGTQNENMSKADNDPCPEGWKVPSQAQWASIFRGGTTAGAPNTATANTWIWTGNGFKVGYALYLPAAGHRPFSNGIPGLESIYCGYWSSTHLLNDLTYSLILKIGSTSVGPNELGHRASGGAVRCVAE